MIVASREHVAEQLWLRDEREMAIAVLDTNDETLRQIRELAAQPGTGGRFTRQVDTLLALAAVQVLTGSHRNLNRRWPRRGNAVAGLWRRVGPERDARSSDPSAAMRDLLRSIDPPPSGPAD